uniref:Acrosin n=1 Tax=Tityus serrulatus TaxID=6887 RepID=U6JRN4_TITSE|nr:CUB and LDL domains-containing trypsin-like serine peptidase 2 protein [Tityus serrulatus]
MWKLTVIILIFLHKILCKTDICDEENPEIIQVTRRSLFYSPGYASGQYPKNVRCVYAFLSAPDTFIRLSFNDFDLENTTSCNGDNFAIFNEFSIDQKPRYVFCGSVLPYDVISENNKLYVSFYSDWIHSGRGFNVTYEPLTSKLTQEFACKNRKLISKSSICNGVDDCGDGTDEEKCGLPPSPTPECGVPPVSHHHQQSEDRIVGGSQAIPGSWPWQIDLQQNNIEPNSHTCGGSLINSLWAVSAAHCFKYLTDKTLWRIHLGNHNKYKRDDLEIVRYIDKLIIYPDVDEETFLLTGKYDINNDMSLLKLNAPVGFNDYISPVCLPQRNLIFSNKNKCFVTGWGETRGTGGSDVLNQAEQRLYEIEECNLPPYFKDTSNMICAGDEIGKQGGCHGDSGGPLVCLHDNKWYLVGVVSFLLSNNYLTTACGVDETLAIYSNVSNKFDWINSMIEKYT